MKTWLTTAIGTILRDRRKQLGLSLSELSRASGACTSTLVRIEHGSVDADVCLLDALATALEMDLSSVVAEATRLDRERVLLVELGSLTSLVARSHRDVLTTDDLSMVVRLLDDWRVDVIAFLTEPDYPLLAELAHRHPKVRYLFADVNDQNAAESGLVELSVIQQALAGAIDALLLTTHKGLVASLRRRRDELRERKQMLNAARVRLAQQSLRLSRQIELLDEQQEQLAQLARNLGGKWTSEWEAKREDFTKLRERLNKRVNLLERQARHQVERSKFLDKGEESLSAQIEEALKVG